MRTLIRLLFAWLGRWLAVRKPSQRFAGPREATTSEYLPRADGQPDPGEVVWTWVTYEDDPSRGKDRPVLIVGRRGARLRGLALTSRPDGRDLFELGTGPWDREGRTSYVKLGRVLDLDPASVRREGAALDRARFDRVVAALDRRAS